MHRDVVALLFSVVAAIATAVSPAYSQTLSECEQKVQYNLAPVAADVPENFRSFSGIWVGKWANALCSVLIVEEVNKDGSVAAKYLYGTYAPWNINRAGTSAYTGKIINGVLTLRRNNVTIEYRATSPNELAGTFTANNQETGIFRRR
jgi:hypothetical protein